MSYHSSRKISNIPSCNAVPRKTARVEGERKNFHDINEIKEFIFNKPAHREFWKQNFKLNTGKNISKKLQKEDK